ncbi:MAG: phosphate signaling complex protein PhoU [Thermodesulfobacteriota bacterium]|tara:strand:- start:14997 stop:15653 length:657 start_codon:yes stop_codon:yes gene_type:complete
MSELISELELLRNNLVKMATLAEENVNLAIKSLQERDADIAKTVLINEEEVNNCEIQLDDKAIEILALFQPLTEDLRFITMAMHITKDLERIGDHAVNIAKKSITLLDHPPINDLSELTKMGYGASKMVNQSIKAFIRGDKKLSLDVCEMDNEIDDAEVALSKELISLMKADSTNIDSCKSLVLIVKDIERIADLATNIAEDTYYIKTGNIIKHGHKF